MGDQPQKSYRDFTRIQMQEPERQGSPELRLLQAILELSLREWVKYHIRTPEPNHRFNSAKMNEGSLDWELRKRIIDSWFFDGDEPEGYGDFSYICEHLFDDSEGAKKCIRRQLNQTRPQKKDVA